MLWEALDALERRCREEAPQLVDAVVDLRRLATVRSSARTLVSQLDEAGPASDDPTRDAPDLLSESGRAYKDLGLIGTGGMGEVRRVRDLELNRALAMKIMGPALARSAAARARFLEEAQATAQLQHPGVVSVHEVGRLSDGRPYFTMREVRGRTFAQALESESYLPAGLRRLVGWLNQASLAVAYAHDRGVLHRDLKPDNLMIGDFGEVLVVDWGLVKVQRDRSDPLRGVVTDRSLDDASTTRAGSVAGTPSYMAPEQARGEIDGVDPRTDVYGLGALLYEILAGEPPYSQVRASSVLAAVVTGPPRPLPDDVPPELAATCNLAMARDMADRFDTAASFAAALQDWLEGAQRRARGLEIVDRVAQDRHEPPRLARATALRRQAAERLAALPSYAPETEKWQAWTLEDQAEALDLEAGLVAVRAEQQLHAALEIAPDLEEAHAALAARARRQHTDAETARDRPTAAAAEVRLRRHAAALPAGHPERLAAERWLVGTGSLTLRTLPEGANVMLHRYHLEHRRLVLRPEADLGASPLVTHPLSMGSYVCVLTAPGYDSVRYPVHIERGSHWDDVRPGSDRPWPVHLPPAGVLGPDDCLIPAGWFLAGDPNDEYPLPRTRCWCDDLVVRRFPVTQAEYLEFLNQLVADGLEDEALAHAPRLGGDARTGIDEGGTLVFHRRADGTFTRSMLDVLERFPLDAPVLQVDWFAARRYAEWTAARTGRPWRLPTELEWEKAARGVDGRRYPFGDHVDPTWAHGHGSHRRVRMPCSVHDYPIDESPHGVRGMAGNAREWCDSPAPVANEPPPPPIVAPPVHVDDPEHRSIRGGSWVQRDAQATARSGASPSHRDYTIGFRLVRSVVAEDRMR